MRSFIVSGRFGLLPVVLALFIAAIAACDLPTEPPRFELTTGVSAPLLVDKTFVLLGPSDTGYEPLIDTTSSRFDSIFTVDGSTHSLSIMQEIDGFDLDIGSNVLPDLSVAPIAVSFEASEIAPVAPPGGGSFPYQPDGATFSHSGEIDLSIDDVHFDGTDEFVGFSSATFRIADLTNELDIDIDELIISVPSIRLAPYAPADTLVIRFAGPIDDSNTNTFRYVERRSVPRSHSIDLDEARLYADGGAISYAISGRTESADDVRILSTDEQLRMELSLADVTLSEISASIDPFDVAVTADVDGNGQIDVYNDTEAEVASFDGLDIFDEVDLDGFMLSGSELRLNVRSNIGADFVLYAALLGIDEDGQSIYLEGRGDAAVAPSDPVVDWFAAGGAPIHASRLIRLELEGAPSPDTPVTRSLVLNDQNSNVNAFLSEVPTELRMVARLVVEPIDGRVHLRQPFLLETSFQVRIPLAVQSGFSIDKTFDADLSDLADVSLDSNDVGIENAALEIGYANGLPLGMQLGVDVLDTDGAVVASFPRPGDSMRVDAATTDAAGFAAAPAEGTFTLGISQDDITAMSRGTRIRVQFSLDTDGGGRAALRAIDTFTLRLNGRFRVRLTAD